MKNYVSFVTRALAAAVIIMMLISCGSGGSSGSSGKLKVRIKIDQNNFRSSDARLKVNGYTISSLFLSVYSSAAAYDSGKMNILSDVENSGYVTLTLDKDFTYLFSIEAKDTGNNTLCSGSTSALISKDENTVNLTCDSDNFSFDTTLITGVAASGLPVTGKVYLKDANGTVVSTDIQPDGSYSISTVGLTPPFILKAEGVVGTSPVSMVSYTQGASSVVNINPFTDLAVVMAAGASNSADLFDTPESFSANLSNESVTNAVSQVTAIFSEFLSSMGITNFDPLSGTYSADGTGADGVLDYVGVNISNGVVTVVNKTTGQALITSSVSQVAQNTITGTVVSEIVQYVTAGPAQLAEAKTFITDIYTTRSRGAFSAYVDTDMVWHNGLSRAAFIAEGFPEETSVQIEHFQMYNRISSSEIVVYYYVTHTDGTVTPEFQWVINKNGTWYISGNDRMFQRNSTMFAVQYDAYNGTETYRSGVRLSVSDPSAQGIEIVTVTGPGLPAAGIRLIPVDGIFEIYEADRADPDFTEEYFFTSAQTAAFNSAIASNGFAQYTYTAYTAVNTASMTPSGTPLQTLTENLRTRSLTTSSLQTNAANYFIDTPVSDQDLTNLIEDAGITENFTLPANDVLYGMAAIDCYDTSGESYYQEIPLPLTGGIFSIDTSAVPANLLSSIESCDVYLGYMSNTLAFFVSGWEYQSSGGSTDPGTGPTDAEVLSTALASFDISDILGNNISADEIYSSLNLITSLGNGITVSWASSDEFAVSTSGAVTNAPHGQGDTAVTLTATVTYGTASQTVQFSVTLPELEPEPGPTDAEVLSNALTSFDISDILGINASADEVYSVLNLMTTLGNGINVSWASSDEFAVSTSGAVTNAQYGKGDTTVTLTATVTYGTASQTMQFSVTLPELAQLDSEVLGNALTSFDISDILGGNASANEVYSPLSLITSLGNGINVSWASSDESAVSTSGVVTNAQYGQGDTTVTLTATVTYGTASQTMQFTVTLPELEQSDSEVLSNALTSFDISDILGINASADEVYSALNLMTTLGNGINVSWASSDESAVSTSGVVTNAQYGNGNTTVTLTANVTYGTASQTVQFTVTLPELEQSDSEVLSNALTSFDISDILGINASADEVYSALNLMTTLGNGINVSWASSDESAVSTSGVVTNAQYGNGDTVVTLTANVTYGTASQTVQFTVTLPELEPDPQTMLADAYTELLTGEFLDENSASDNIISELWLPISFDNGVMVSWESSNPSVVSASGQVTRPSYSEGDASVTLTATLSFNGVTTTQTINLTVTALPATDAELVAEAIEFYSIEDTLYTGDTASSVTGNLSLASSINTTSVTWSSSDDTVITDTGIVYRPTYTSGDETVTMTATVTLNSASASFSYTYTVKEADETHITGQIMLSGLSSAVVEIYDLDDPANPIITTSSSAYDGSMASTGTFSYSNAGMTREHSYLVMAYGGTASDTDYDGVYDMISTFNNGTVYAVLDGMTAVEGTPPEISGRSGTGQTTGEPSFIVNEVTDLVYRANRYALSTDMDSGKIKDALTLTAKTILSGDLDGDGEVTYSDALAYNRYEDYSTIAAPSELFGSYSDSVIENSVSLYSVELLISNVNDSVILPDMGNITYSGNYMYGITNSGYLQIYDVTDMTNPVETSSVSISGQAYSFEMQLVSDYLFIYDISGEQVIIVDVSNPGSPEVLSSTTITNMSHMAVTPDGNRILAGSYTLGFLYNYISNDKSSPVVDSGAEITVSEEFDNIAVDSSGEYLFIDYDTKLSVVNISTQTQVSELTYQDILSDAEAIHVFRYEGGYIYIGTNKGMYILNASDPANVTLLKKISTDYGVTSVDIDGSTLYVFLGETAELSAYDISDPANPVQTGYSLNYAYNESVSGIAMKGGYGFFLDGTQATLIDMGFTTAKTFGELVNTEHGVYRMQLGYGTDMNYYAYTTAEGNGSIAVYEINQSEAPDKVFEYTDGESSNYMQNIVVNSDFAYAKTNSDLYTFDFSDMGSPQLAAKQMSYSGKDPLVSKNNSLFMADTTYVEEFTLGSTDRIPAATPASHEISSGVYAYDMVFVGDYLYAAEADGGYLRVIEPGTGVVGSVEMNHPITLANIHDEYLAVYDLYDAAIKIYDVSSAPETPVLVGSTNSEAYYLQKLTVSGNYMYGITSNWSLTVYDISDVTKPKEMTSFKSISEDVTADEDYVYLAKGMQGYLLLPAVTKSLPDKNLETIGLEDGLEILTDTLILNGNSGFDNIRSNLSLITSSIGTDVEWTSSDEAVIGTDGTVTRPETGEPDAEVMLTAEITYGNETVTLYYYLTVKAETIASARVNMGVLSDGNVDIYARSDLSTPIVSTTTTAYSGDADETGYFSYDYSLFEEGASSDEIYLVHAYNGTAVDGYYNYSLRTLTNKGNIYAIVTRQDLLDGGFGVNTLADIVYRNASYILITDAPDADLLSMLDNYAKVYIPSKLDEDDPSTDVNYNDVLAFDPYSDNSSVNINYTKLMSYDEHSFYDEVKFSEYMLNDYNIAGTKTIGQTIHNLTAKDDKLYIPKGSGGFYICDLASSAALGSCSSVSVDTGNDVQDIAVHSGYAYVANGGNGVNAIDLANTSSSADLYNDITDTEAVATDGKFVYALDSGTGLNVFEIDYPSALNGMTYSMNLIYNLDYTAAPYYYSDTYPQDILLAGAKATDGDTSDDYLIALLTSAYLVIDISGIDGDTPTASVTYYPTDEFGNSIMLNENLKHGAVLPDASAAYIASDKGIKVLNLADKSAPEESIIAGGEKFADTLLSGTNLYAVSKLSSIIFKYDVSSALSPVLTGKIYGAADLDLPGEDYVSSMALNGDYIYTGDDEQVAAVDTANTIDLSYGTYYTAEHPVSDIKVSNGYAYTAASLDTMAIYDVSDTSSPYLISGLTDPSVTDDLTNIELKDNYAYLSGYGNLVAVNISDTASPYIADVRPVTNGGGLLIDSGGILYHSADTSLNLFDLSGMSDSSLTLSSTPADTRTTQSSLGGLTEYDDYVFGVYYGGSSAGIFMTDGSTDSTFEYYVSTPSDIAVIDSDIAILDFDEETGMGAVTLLDMTSFPVLSPDYKTTLKFDSLSFSMHSDGTFLYAAGHNGVTILAPSSSTGDLYIAGFIPTPYSAEHVYTDDDNLYIAGSNAGMIIVPKPKRAGPFVLNSTRMYIGEAVQTAP